MPETDTKPEETTTETPVEPERKEVGPRAALLAEVARQRALREKKPT